MRAGVPFPDGGEIVLDDGVLSSYRAALGEQEQRVPRTRWTLAAAHVVLRDAYAAVERSSSGAEAAEELEDYVDWDSTRALRRHLDGLGFGVAEAMDTAQRFEIGWPVARRLIEECGRLRLANGFVAGASTDHLDEVAGASDLVDGVLHQIDRIQAAGGIAVLLPMPWLARNAAGPREYVEVYGAIVRAARGPLLVHWLGEMFLPELAGYFPGESFLDVMALDPSKVRGAKLSLLDPEREVALRRALAANDQVLLTGDDHSFVRLIRGGGCEAEGDAASVEGWTTVGQRRVARGDFSHALLGAFDAIAAPASLALEFLDRGDTTSYAEILGPCEELSRHLFAAPTSGYKAGLAFLAWLDGRQENRMLVNRREADRDRDHLLRAAVLASRAGIFADAELVADRLRSYLRES